MDHCNYYFALVVTQRGNKEIQYRKKKMHQDASIII